MLGGSDVAPVDFLGAVSQVVLGLLGQGGEISVIVAIYASRAFSFFMSAVPFLLCASVFCDMLGASVNFLTCLLLYSHFHRSQ